MPNAKMIVASPMVPPNVQPIATTTISIEALTQAIGKPVTRWNPVMSPSLGPGPRFVIKYIPLAKPTNTVPIQA